MADHTDEATTPLAGTDSDTHPNSDTDSATT